MSRKGENIRKRKDGRWEARFIKGRDADGKAVYGSVYANSYVNAKKAKQLSMAQARATAVSGPKIDWPNCCSQWQDSLCGRIKESSLVKYKGICSRYLIPYFTPQPELLASPEALECFSQHLLRSGGKNGRPLSIKTVNDILLVLRAILAHCRRNGQIPYGAKISAVRQSCPKTPATLTPQEQERLLLQIDRGDRALRMAVLLSLYAGMRLGEICALQWKNVNFQSGSIQVARTVSRIQDLTGRSSSRTKLLVDTPKTQNSQRIIPLPPLFARYLQRCRQAENTYVLTGTQKLMEPRALYGRYKRVLQNCNLGSYTFHSLRHTFATRCVEIGVDIKSLSEILGHTDIQITLNRYVHPSMETKRRELSKLPFFPG